MELEEVKSAITEHGEAVNQFREGVKQHNEETNDRLDQIEAKMGSGAFSNMTKRKAPGAYLADKMLETEELKHIQEKGLARNTSIRIDLPNIELRAIVGDNASSPDDGYPVQAQRDNQIYGHPFRRLSFLDLMPVHNVVSNAYEYVKTTNKDDNAGYQAYEGATKNETDIGFDLSTANIKTLAHVVHASRQVLDDSAGLTSFIQTKMMHGVRQKLENELLNGTGGGDISGLLTEAPAFVPTTSRLIDQISESITTIQVSDYEPTALVMHPQQWHQIRTARATTDEFLVGSFVNPAAQQMWGLPVVATRSVPNGKVLVGDFQRGCALLSRMGVAFEISRDHGNNFIENMVTFLAELRAGLAIYDTAAFNVITLGSPIEI